MSELHTKADLGEGRVPIRWQLGLLMVKTSFLSREVERTSVGPKLRIVVESLLEFERDHK